MQVANKIINNSCLIYSRCIIWIKLAPLTLAIAGALITAVVSVTAPNIRIIIIKLDAVTLPTLAGALAPTSKAK